MEVDPAPVSRPRSGAPPSSSCVAPTNPSGSTSGVSVRLHPLVIMNISEHWTRSKVQRNAPGPVYGALIGRQDGRDIEVMNSFELTWTVSRSGQVVIGVGYYETKEQQFKQVFANMDLIGWYCTGEEPTENEVGIQRQLLDLHDSPICLQLNPLSRTTDLPVSIYESFWDMAGAEDVVPASSEDASEAAKKKKTDDGAMDAEMASQGEPTKEKKDGAAASGPRLQLVKLPYSLETGDAERIGLDHVARITGGSEEGQSKVAEHVAVQHSAIKMLASRVRLILDYVRAVEAGELPHNHEIMRQAKALSDRLPVLDSAKFKPEFYEQSNDGALIAYLGTVMKSCNNLNQYISKFNMMHQKQGGGRRMRGLFF